ncbi:Ferric/cupric reductase transmembrane component B [Psilocybe cubensis]|uniref:Ferric/cupric reductase transmembrane component B n=2 Tax=Psilocybe cubensis TaxID=181762 RepID=A0ACB8H4F5_PSICU|nr:Ferric/cupric reductase transmembrane component B [Psilocybe cubensis]KAH9482731.1 Ferric/cupric reductase transmembrane component B [Psilocybe cubensis]
MTSIVANQPSVGGTNGTTGSPGRSTGSPTGAGAGIEVDSEMLMFHVNIVCLILLGVLTLVRLPHAFGLFSSKEWLGSQFLRQVSTRPTVRRLATQDIYSPTSTPKGRGYTGYGSSDDSHMYAQPALRLTEKGTPTTIRFPTNIPVTWFMTLRPILSPLRSRVMPGFSVAQAFVVVMYFYAMVYAVFFQSNIITDSNRTGWIAVSQLPLVFAFAQKNSIPGGLIGYGYEKLNFLHRFAGRIVVLTTNIHTFHWVYKWSLAGTFSTKLKQPSNMWALIATCCFNLIFLFSTAYWRQKAYTLFLSSHIIGFSLVLPAIYMHKKSTFPYVVTAAVLFAVDHLLRVVKTRCSTAFLRPIPELGLTRVEIPGINAGWRAGQHVRLRVVSSGMGLLGWAENHPFTVANISNTEEGMVLLCKESGDWTRRLEKIAKSSTHEGTIGRQVKVMVEGPYGGTQRTIFSSFSGALFVVGGSGITFALSLIQDLIQKDLEGNCRVKVIELIWIVKDPACLTPLLSTFSNLIKMSAFIPVRISVFYTRAPTGQQPSFFESVTDGPYIGKAPSFKVQPQHLPPGITLSPGRPRIVNFINLTLQRIIALRSSSQNDVKLTGLIIGVCGPLSLADDVAKAVSNAEVSQRDHAGGIEVSEETFGW